MSLVAKMQQFCSHMEVLMIVFAWAFQPKSTKQKQTRSKEPSDQKKMLKSFLSLKGDIKAGGSCSVTLKNTFL